MMKCESCTKYEDCRTGSGLTWPCGAYRPNTGGGMDIEKLIEDLRIACAGNQHNIMGVAATALSTLQDENEKMQKQLNEFSKFLCHMTGGLLSKTNYTSQEMISAAEDYQQRVCGECDLRAENEKLWAELEQVKVERDAAEKCIQSIAKSGRVWMCPYCIHAKDTTGGIAECELDVGVCMMPYSKFEWRGQKDD